MVLKKLSLHGSSLKELLNTIGSLASLEELYLQRTRITLLPESIRNLKRLEVIDVSQTPIKMLPKDLVKLENLVRLEAFRCKEMDINPLEEIGKLSCLRTLNLCGTKISRVPTTINQLSHLLDLHLYEMQEPQELLRLPTSVKVLNVKSQSLKLHHIPDLSYMTNLDSLQLWDGANNGVPKTSPSSAQTLSIKWLARLPKLRYFVLLLSDLISPPIELSSLSCLQFLGITCYNPKSLSHLPSSLLGLALCDVESPIDWKILSSLNNLSTLELCSCRLKEIKVNCLRQPNNLSICDCKSVESLCNLSSLKELQSLYLINCPHLVDIEGLGELKVLSTLELRLCDSIQRLPDLSRLKKLKHLAFCKCESLESVPEVDEETSCWLELDNCKHFRYFKGPYSERHRALIT